MWCEASFASSHGQAGQEEALIPDGLPGELPSVARIVSIHLRLERQFFANGREERCVDFLWF